MSRLQKKCFIGATSLHGLLLLALIVGPGFFTKQTVDDSPVIEFVPMMASPDNSTGGGSPRPPANNPPPQVVPQPVQPTPPPPEVQKEVRQEKVEKVKEVEPEKTEPEKNIRPDPDALVVKLVKPKQREVKTGNKIVKLATAQQVNNSTATAKAQAEAAANAKANADWKKALAKAGNNISSGISSSTRVDMPEGPGGGGVSYAPYGQIVRKIYTDGWRVPDDMTDDEATVKVSVTIKSDGTVLSSRIVQPSSSAAANRSIQNTLDRITTIGIPFPSGAKESQRTFIMTFNLKAKKAFG